MSRRRALEVQPAPAMPEGFSSRQLSRVKTRQVRRTWTASAAAEAVGEIPPGGSVFGVSKGRWSLLDLFDHLLTQVGEPADVVISTWTAALADAETVWEWLRDGRIARCRLILDFTIHNRAPAYLEAFRARFGSDAVRLTDNHCKYLVIRGGGRSFSVVTSMNLNENLRMEWWEVADDVGRADYLLEIADLMFREIDPVQQLHGSYTKHKRTFAELGEGDKAAAVLEHERRQRAWFGDGPWDVDIRRAGITFQP